MESVVSAISGGAKVSNQSWFGTIMNYMAQDQSQLDPKVSVISNDRVDRLMTQIVSVINEHKATFHNVYKKIEKGPMTTVGLEILKCIDAVVKSDKIDNAAKNAFYTAIGGVILKNLEVDAPRMVKGTDLVDWIFKVLVNLFP